jgi:hypothetical protein
MKSILFQIIAGLYYLNNKLKIMYYNLILNNIVYIQTDENKIFQYKINGKSYYVKTYGYLIGYFNYINCLNDELRTDNLLKTHVNYRQMSNTNQYTQFKLFNTVTDHKQITDRNQLAQFKLFGSILNEFIYRFLEPHQLIADMRLLDFGKYKHDLRNYYKYMYKYLKINKHVPKNKYKWDRFHMSTDDIAKYDKEAITEIYLYLKDNNFDDHECNNIYRKHFRNNFFTYDVFADSEYGDFTTNLNKLKHITDQLFALNTINVDFIEEHFSSYNELEYSVGSVINEFDFDKEFVYDRTNDVDVDINIVTEEVCEEEEICNTRSLTLTVKPILIKKNIMKIFSMSDIHGDIMSFIVNLRDCCEVIRKKREYSFDKFTMTDNDTIYELNKTHEKIYSDINKNERYMGVDKYLDDLNYEWCGGNSVVVLCGDMIDNLRSNVKGEYNRKIGEYPMEEAKILLFINKLNKDARKSGGHIFKLVGNHEMRNITIIKKKTKTVHMVDSISNYANDPENYPDINVCKEFMYLSNRQRFFLPGNAGALLLAEDGIHILLVIKNFMFVHGGISNKLITIKNIEFLNNFLNQFLIKGNIKNDILFNHGNEMVKIIDELLLNETSIIEDRTFGYLAHNRKGSKNENIDGQCIFLKERMNEIYTDLLEYKQNITRTPVNIDKEIYLDVNVEHTSDEYVECLSNFWYGGSDLTDSNINLVMGHTWQHFTGINERIITNDLKITKEIASTDSHTVYGLTHEIKMNKEYHNRDEKVEGVATNCSTETIYPRLYRLDVATSYSFNDIALEYDTTLEGQHYRFPQALCITYSGNEYIVNIIKTSLKLMYVHMPDLIKKNIPESDPFDFRKKYIKYKRKLNTLNELIGYRFRRNWATGEKQSETVYDRQLHSADKYKKV